MFESRTRLLTDLHYKEFRDVHLSKGQCTVYRIIQVAELAGY